MNGKIKQQVKILLPYGITMAALFFLLPFIYLFISEASLVPFVILATVNPVVLVALSVVYVLKNGFAIHYHLVIGALFFLSVLVHYPIHTAPYAIYYMLVTGVFAFLVQMFKKQ